MFDQFTEAARTAIVEAQAEAVDRADAFIGSGHLLIGLLREGTGPATAILAERSVTLDSVRAALDELVGPAPSSIPADAALATIGIDLGRVHAQLESTFGPDALAPPPVPFDTEAKEALQSALAEATSLDQPVDTDHELLGLALTGEGVAATILGNLGIDGGQLVTEVRGRAAGRAD